MVDIGLFVVDVVGYVNGGHCVGHVVMVAVGDVDGGDFDY